MCVSSKSIIETPPVTVLRWMPELFLVGPQPRLGRAPLLLLLLDPVPLQQGGQPDTATGVNATGLKPDVGKTGDRSSRRWRSRRRPSGTRPFDASTVCERITLILSLPIFWSLTAVRVLVPAVLRCAAAAAVQGSMHAMRTSGLYHTEPQRRSP